LRLIFFQVQALSFYAQLQQRDELDLGRYQHALDTLLLAEKEAEQMINDMKAAIAEHDLKGASLKQDAVALRESRDPTANQSIPRQDNGDKGKGRAKESNEIEEELLSSPNDQVLEGLPKNPAGEEHAIKRRALQHRLRECYLLLHKVSFLKGDVYNVLGADYSKDEDASYGKAEELRRKLLKSTCSVKDRLESDYSF
jgi:E3 ubiquitin-protein ligase SHPRH